MALLDVRDLAVTFSRRGLAPTRAVDQVSFTVERGQTVGLVGESGCGKSVTSLAIMGLLPRRGVRVTGSVLFEGTDLLRLSSRQMRDRRGRDIGMIFQDPLNSLNPVVPIGVQVTEVLERHRAMKGRAAKVEAERLLTEVGIPDPNRRLSEYPHQLSGGMRQRALIATALACRPRLLIADEPTTALDVTIQAQILKLMLELKERTGAAVILITHDLGVVAETCRRVIVMYAGRKIEEAPILELFDRPAHPYTRGLMASIPRYHGRAAGGRKRRLAEIPGIVPSLREEIQGCAFAPRCPYAVERCRIEAPPLRVVGGGHSAACHFAEEVMAQGVLAA